MYHFYQGRFKSSATSNLFPVWRDPGINETEPGQVSGVNDMILAPVLDKSRFCSRRKAPVFFAGGGRAFFDIQKFHMEMIPLTTLFKEVTNVLSITKNKNNTYAFTYTKGGAMWNQKKHQNLIKH